MQTSDRILFLLTKTYPFGNGEQYITNELPYLSKYFKKIVIYPNDYYSKDEEHDKILPNGVEVLNFNQLLPKKSKNTVADYFCLVKYSLLEFIETDDKKNFFKNFEWNLINFWAQLQIAKSFSGYLSENNYNSSNTIFYSYWFHKSVMLLSIMKNKKQIDKYVARAHSIDLYHNYWGIINNEVKVPPFKMFKLKHVTKLFCISNHGTAFLQKNYPRYANKIITARLGVENSVVLLRNNDSGTFTIATCSGINSNKRIHLLAEALLKVGENAVIKWIHFGWGGEKFVNELRNISQKFPNNISLQIMGQTPNKSILDFYHLNKINLFVNLSVVEGLPVSIMEAMQFGIPVIATKVYGTPEIVLDNENGFLLDVDFNVNELSEKIEWCIKNVNTLRQMENKARQAYLEKFNAKKNYTQFVEFLLNV